MSRTAFGLAFLALFGLALSTAPASADCPGVNVTVLTTASWQVHSFQSDEQEALALTLIVDEIDSNTTVEYFDGGSWIGASAPLTVLASRVRLTLGGSASMRIKKSDCEDEIQLQDE